MSDVPQPAGAGGGSVTTPAADEFLDAVVEYEGELFRVYGYSDGDAVHMRSLERQPCASCGRPFDHSFIVGSSLFAKLKPVKTLCGGGPA